LKTPKKVGAPIELCPRVFGKAMVNQTFKSPSGEEYDFGLFDWKSGKVAPSMAFPLTNDLEVVALKQFRHGANEIVWEIPGGCPSAEEPPLEVVANELLEETGFQAGNLQLLTPKPMWWEPSALTVPYRIYLATGCKKICEPKPDKTEYIEVVLVPWEKWLKMTKDGTVLDSKTIVATHLAEDYVKNLSK